MEEEQDMVTGKVFKGHNTVLRTYPHITQNYKLWKQSMKPGDDYIRRKES